jgi:outer membrane protein assembly factor BamA
MMKRTTHILGLLLVLASGGRSQEAPAPSLTVREVVVKGNELTKDFIILREMKLKPGEPITREALEHDQKRIYSLQLFNKVEVDAQPEGSEATVVVTVDERWYFFPFPILGFRFRDTKNLYYGAGVLHDNFRGRNEKLIGSFALGFDRWIQFVYQNPKITDDDDIFFRGQLMYAKVQNLSKTNGIYDQTNFKSGLMLGKRYGLYYTVLGWIDYDIWKISDPGLRRTVSPDGKDAFLTLGANLVYDTRDVREYPTGGVYISLLGRKYGVGESEVDFFRYGYDARAFVQLMDDLTLATRSFSSLVGGGILPTYRNVYFGYDERIRGHFNTVLEGEHIFGFSTEFRMPILEPRYYVLPFDFIPQFRTLRYGLYAGIFFDAGKTWNRGDAFGSIPWHAGYGGGLHFLLPYSLVVRTEYGVNLEGRGQVILDFGVSF